MREGTRTAPLVEGPVDEVIVGRAIAAAKEAPLEGRIGAGLEAVIEIAETDPAAVRSALNDLRGDHRALARLEACLGDGDDRATLRLGAAIQLALSELASSSPDLRSRRSELTRWLEGGW
jgi:hypothetical protein